jgi:mRNA interferase MazF
MAKRFEVWIVRLDPVLGSEIGKTRPAVVISPDEANNALRTVLIAPLTSVRRNWPTRVPVSVSGTNGDVALDQIRVVDKHRLTKRMTALTRTEAMAVADRLIEMFTY